MQQIYQQQMEAQANHTLDNEEKKSSGMFEIPDLANLNLNDSSGPVAGDQEERSQTGFETGNENENENEETKEGEEHECSEECGFCSDDESKFFFISTFFFDFQKNESVVEVQGFNGMFLKNS